MAYLSKKEFAEVCILKTKDLSNYIKRGKVIVRTDELIDTDTDVNKAFIENRRAKMDVALADPEIASDKPGASRRMGQILGGDKPEKVDDTGLMSVVIADRHYKHHLAIKTERAAELDRLKIEKAKGIVVPSEPIIPIFLQHNQHILQEQKNADEEMLSLFAHKYGISSADTAHIRGEWVKRRNAAVQKATDATKKAIPALINDYSEKRGVGQRN